MLATWRFYIASTGQINYCLINCCLLFNYQIKRKIERDRYKFIIQYANKHN